MTEWDQICQTIAQELLVRIPVASGERGNTGINIWAENSYVYIYVGRRYATAISWPDCITINGSRGILDTGGWFEYADPAFPDNCIDHLHKIATEMIEWSRGGSHSYGTDSLCWYVPATRPRAPTRNCGATIAKRLRDVCVGLEVVADDLGKLREEMEYEGLGAGNYSCVHQVHLPESDVA